jgi:integrase
MGIRKYRGQILCVKDWPDGKRFKRKCANRTEAKNLLGDIEASIRNGTWPEYRESLRLRNRFEEKITVEQFSETYVDDYAKVRNKRKAWKRKKTSFNALNPVLGHLDLREVSPAHLHNYVRKRKRDGLSEATINRDLTILKHMLTYAVECGVIDTNSVERFRLLREEKRERPRFTEKQVWSVINAVRPDCRPIFVFIRETGCRREEALSLQHWQVHEESRLVVFSEDTKSRKFRYVPLTDSAAEAVKALPRLETCSYVFYNTATKDRWCECRKPWKEAREEVGVLDLLVKDLRRQYAIHLAENGADMHDIQQVLGHASVATTEKHYAQFSPKHSAMKILKVIEGGRAKELTRNFSQWEVDPVEEEGAESVTVSTG